MIRPGKRVATTLLITLATAATAFFPLCAMELPECDRPDVSQRSNRHAARHYVENPGPIGRPDVSFYSYSFLNPPDANTHHIRNSVCNTHKENPLSFKWEPVGLAYDGLPKGECYCPPFPLSLKHDEVEVLDTASIQFTNTSSRNRLPAIAFVRKKAEHSEDASPIQNYIDVIIRQAERVFKERIWFSSSWTRETTSLDVRGETDKFIIAFSLPPDLLARVSGQIGDRKKDVGSELVVSSITDLSIKGRDWVPEKMLKGGVVAVLPKAPKFDDRIFSTAATAVETIEVQAAIFSNDNARNFIAAAPIAIYAPASR
jgi:hypothetical protein